MLKNLGTDNLHFPGKQILKGIYGLLVAITGILFFPVFLLLYLFRKHAIAILAISFPLLTVILYSENQAIRFLPPILIVSLVFLLIGVFKRKNYLIEFIYSNKSIIIVYGIILAIELLSLINTGFSGNLAFVAGRVAFFIIILSVYLNAITIEEILKALKWFTIGVFILGLLTILHAFDLFYLPIAGRLFPPRTFLGFTMPFPRTIGIDMTLGKFGIMVSLALPVILFSLFSILKVFRQKLSSLILLVAIFFGILILQSRSVYITTMMVSLFTVILALQLRKSSDLKTSQQFLIVFIAIATLAFLVIAAFSQSIVEADLFDVGARSYLNAVDRITINRLAYTKFLENPLFGIGHGLFNISSISELTGIHNHFLEQFVATGFLGGTFYVLFFVLLFNKAWNILQLQDNNELRNLGGLFFVALVGTVIQYQFFPGFLVETTALIIGLLLSVHSIFFRAR